MKNFKKLFVILIAFVCAFSVVACEGEPSEHNHTYGKEWTNNDDSHWRVCTDDGCDSVAAKAAHEYGEPTVTDAQIGVEGSKVYTCKVCGKTKSEVIPAISHEHNFSEGWVSDSEKHWHACEDEICASRDSEAAHVWDDGNVLKEATSGIAGEMRYTCEVCDQTKTVEIPALPDKMSEADWKALFVFDNVKVDCSSEMLSESLITTAVAFIDGEYVEEISEGESYVSYTKDFIIEFDFSLNYSSFNNMGEGVYFAETISVEADGMSVELENVTVVFDDKHILSVSYDMNIFGVICKLSYEFSDWGEVSVEIPTVDSTAFSEAINEENFHNYTIEYYYYSETDDTLDVSGTIYFNGNEYLEYSYDYEYNETQNSETVENAGVIMNPVLSILSSLSAEDFDYDAMLEMLSCKPAPLAEIGFDYIYVYIEEGKLLGVYYGIEGDFGYSYDFYDYGTTEIAVDNY